MRGAQRFERCLRWYPSNWRSRYGAEMEALLEDTYGSRAVPLRTRLALVGSGLHQWTRETGVLGASASWGDRVKSGSLQVLVGWSFFVVAGSVFAKFSEHWSFATPHEWRRLPSIGYAIVEIGGAVGATLIILASLAALPGLRRLGARSGWRSLRRPFTRTFLAIASLGVVTFSLALWAHHLSPHERNGGLHIYGDAFLAWSVGVVAVIAVVTFTSASLARQIDFGPRTVRWYGWTSVALSMVMLAIAAGTGLWWVSESAHASTFMSQSIGSAILGHSNDFPLTLDGAGVVMILGLVLALTGSTRVVRTLREGN